ncbi:unnamed protein product, partial [Closterium sp. Naga37s-1]
GTIFGTLMAFAALPLRSLGGDGWKIAAALMGRHIGGAVNYVAVTEALQASPSVVTAALAADNLLCALHFTTLFAIAASIPAEGEGETESSGASDAAAAADTQASTSQPPFDVSAAATALALAASLCWLGSSLAKRLAFVGGTIPCVTALVLAFATVTPHLAAPLVVPGEKMAALMLQVFFASIGANGNLSAFFSSAASLYQHTCSNPPPPFSPHSSFSGANGNLSAILSSAPSLFLFILLQLSLHLLFTLSLGRLLSLPLKHLLISSNANVGGPTTAAGMAASKGWRSLTVPAILVGIFGYATATFLSVALGHTVLKPMHLRALLS